MPKANPDKDTIMQRMSIISNANRLTAAVTKPFRIAMVLYCAQASVRIHPLNPVMRVDSAAAIRPNAEPATKRLPERIATTVKMTD